MQSCTTSSNPRPAGSGWVGVTLGPHRPPLVPVAAIGSPTKPSHWSARHEGRYRYYRRLLRPRLSGLVLVDGGPDRDPGTLTLPNAWPPATRRPKPSGLSVADSAMRCSADSRRMKLLEPAWKASNASPLDTGGMNSDGPRVCGHRVRPRARGLGQDHSGLPPRKGRTSTATTYAGRRKIRGTISTGLN